MAKKTTVSTGEWAKHLRPAGKREFWKKDRKDAKQEVAIPRTQGEYEVVIISADRPVEYGVLDGNTVKVTGKVDQHG